MIAAVVKRALCLSVCLVSSWVWAAAPTLGSDGFPLDSIYTSVITKAPSSGGVTASENVFRTITGASGTTKNVGGPNTGNGWNYKVTCASGLSGDSATYLINSSLSTFSSFYIVGGRYQLAADYLPLLTYVKGNGQLWATGPSSWNTTLTVGNITWSENNAYGGAFLRLDNSITINSVTFKANAKIGGSAGATLTVPVLKLEANLDLAIFNNSASLSAGRVTVAPNKIAQITNVSSFSFSMSTYAPGANAQLTVQNWSAPSVQVAIDLSSYGALPSTPTTILEVTSGTLALSQFIAPEGCILTIDGNKLKVAADQKQYETMPTSGTKNWSSLSWNGAAFESAANSIANVHLSGATTLTFDQPLIAKDVTFQGAGALTLKGATTDISQVGSVTMTNLTGAVTLQAGMNFTKLYLPLTGTITLDATGVSIANDTIFLTAPGLDVSRFVLTGAALPEGYTLYVDGDSLKGYTPPPIIRINEICASTAVLDPNGKASDWVEIQNTTQTNINLDGWALQRIQNKAKTFIFPATNLAARAYAVVYCNEDYATKEGGPGDTEIPGEPLCTGEFNLRASNTPTVQICMPNETVVHALTIPKSLADENSFGYVGVSQGSTHTCITNTTAYKCFLPTSATPASDTWTDPDFDDSQWTSAVGSLGVNSGSGGAGNSGASYTSLLVNYFTDHFSSYSYSFKYTDSSINTSYDLDAFPNNGTPIQAQASVGGRSKVLDFTSNTSSQPRMQVYSSTAAYSQAYVANTYLKNSSEQTFACWVQATTYPDASTMGHVLFFMQPETGVTISGATYTSSEGANIYITPGGKIALNFRKSDKSGSTTITGDADVVDGSWHHVAVTMKPATESNPTGTYSIYIDGRLDTTATSSVIWKFQSNTMIYVGGTEVNSSSWSTFKGYLDGIATATKALSSAEVRAVMNESAVLNGETIDADTTAGTFDETQNDVYVRCPFDLPEMYASGAGVLNLTVKSGVALYLNGVLLDQYNLSLATVPWNASADNTDTDTYNLLLDPDELPLRAGRNVLALQVARKAESGTGAFVSFDLNYTAPSIVDVAVPGTMTIMSPGAENNVNGSSVAGASVVQQTFSPEQPMAGDDIVVSAITQATASAVTGVVMYYRVHFGEEVPVDMTLQDGVWTATIPRTALTTDGQMVRWRFAIKDADGTWPDPVYKDPTSQPKYYGTMTRSQVEDAIPVYYLFIDSSNQTQMDKQYDAISSATSGVGARCSIYYDGTLYDNVRIDLRGNTTGSFTKKSHGLKFNKGYDLEHQPGNFTRKTSWIAEYADPTFLRQSMAFWFMNQIGVKAPYHYPVRIQRNGAFYQLAFLSNRMTDELMESYGWDATDEGCILYKSVGRLEPSMGSASSAGFERRIPEVGNDNAYVAFAYAINSSRPATERIKNIYSQMDVSKWINYLAGTRISHENDDVWANMCLYKDVSGTGVWWPVAYDMNIAWGQFFEEGGWGPRNSGEIADVDRHKSHPLYGGKSVRCYEMTTATKCNDANQGYDAIFSDPVLRQMYLRRLRTLMDQWLKAPGTPMDQTPVMQYIAAYTNRIHATAALDRAKWTDETGTVLYNWPTRITDPVVGVQSMWEKYIEPRRIHLYQTHSIHAENYNPENVGTTFINGTFVSYPAGIPDAQPDGLNVVISNRVSLIEGGTNDLSYVQIFNPNSIYLDVSNWKISGDVKHTLEPGTVIPPESSLYLVADRKAFTATYGADGKFLQGNFSGAISMRDTHIAITDTKGFVAASVDYVGAPSDQQKYLRIVEIMARPVFPVLEYVVVQNIGTTSLDISGCAFTEGITYTFPANTILQPGEMKSLITPTFLGGLKKSGENLRLVDANGNKITDATFDPSWYATTDGLGASLLAVNPTVEYSTYDKAADWYPSKIGGWMGVGSKPTPLNTSTVVINEVFTHSDQIKINGSAQDFVELCNIGTNAVDISGWILTDSDNKNYTFPANAVIQPSQIVALTQAQLGFGFYEAGLGESVTLSATYPGTTELSGYVDTHELGAAPKDKSFSRFITSDGKDYYPFTDPTYTNVNATAIVLPGAVISAIYTNVSLTAYAPFVELTNRTDEDYTFSTTQTRDSVTLVTPCALTGAVNYVFSPTLTLAPNKKVLVVAFDPANRAMRDQFLQMYNIANDTALAGPATFDASTSTIYFNIPATINNDGLEQGLSSAVWVPLMKGDNVHAKAVQSTIGVAAAGEVLQRINLDAFGSEPMAWQRRVVTLFEPGDPGDYMPEDKTMDAIPDFGEYCEPARSININFAHYKDNNTYGIIGSTRTPSGLYPVTESLWNNFVAANTTSNGCTIVAADGVTTTSSSDTSINVSSVSGGWHVNNTPPDAIFKGYIDEDATHMTPTVTIMNVPFATYTVVVYAATDSANLQFGYMTVNGVNYSSNTTTAQKGKTVAHSTANWGHTGASHTSNPVAEGVNTLVIPGQTSSTLTVIGHKGSNARGTIAAIQILEGNPLKKVTAYKRVLSEVAENWHDANTWSNETGVCNWADASAGAPTVAAISSRYTPHVLNVAQPVTLDALYLTAYGAHTLIGSPLNFNGNGAEDIDLNASLLMAKQDSVISNVINHVATLRVAGAAVGCLTLPTINATNVLVSSGTVALETAGIPLTVSMNATVRVPSGLRFAPGVLSGDGTIDVSLGASLNWPNVTPFYGAVALAAGTTMYAAGDRDAIVTGGLTLNGGTVTIVLTSDDVAALAEQVKQGGLRVWQTYNAPVVATPTRVRVMFVPSTGGAPRPLFATTVELRADGVYVTEMPGMVLRIR